MERRYTDAELNALNARVLTALEGLPTSVVHQVLLAGLLGSIQRLEDQGIELPERLVQLRDAASAAYWPLVAALREGPYDGLPVA